MLYNTSDMSLIERSTGYHNIRIAVNSSQIEVPVKAMQEKFGIKLFIRIPELEYPEEAVIGKRLIHFGLPIQDENVGDTFALTRIVENGHYIPGISELSPLLSLRNIWAGHLTDVVGMTTIDEIDSGLFAHTIGNIKNIHELRERILIRYRHSLPTLSDSQILEQGISIREMEFDRRLANLVI